jgi:hypothetical protein
VENKQQHQPKNLKIQSKQQKQPKTSYSKNANQVMEDD